MFSRILIANRGEIACRIIQTAQQLGIHCVAVYSEADANSQHVKMADEAHLLGPAQSSESYLKVDKILEIAKACAVQAIHPGYGFLSENAEFALSCEKYGIVFIGPLAESISAMGSKSAAKEIMSHANVPLVPGYHAEDQDPQLLKAEAEKCGFPLLLKAVAGGGGKGMRVVESLDEFDAALTGAKREATNSFGNSDMLLERYMPKTRHIEVQVFCDTFGNGVYLSQRDCSIQRRHQKIIEEAPAPGIPADVVVAMGEAALDAAKAINYVGAGTVEFLYNEDNSFYFMEMNTRLQVEHPVTEMITNVDLVKWQLTIASGEKLPLSQQQVEVKGHALECRIYAEDPAHDFLPATGTLHHLSTPAEDDNIRIDTGVVQGDEVSVYYDPMISKLIVWGEDREQASSKMAKALSQYHIAGVKNNINFLHRIISSDSFCNQPIDTQFINKNPELLTQSLDSELCYALASCVDILAQSQRAQAMQSLQADRSFDIASQWRMNTLSTREILWQPLIADQDNDAALQLVTVTEASQQLASKNNFNTALRDFSVTVNEQVFSIQAILDNNQLTATVNGKQFKLDSFMQGLQLYLFFNGQSIQLQKPDMSAFGDDGQQQGALTAPMNGRVIAVLVESGQSVKAGAPLIIIEAMKMEHSITAHEDSVVDEIFFNESDLVAEGDKLISMQSDEEQ